MPRRSKIDIAKPHILQCLEANNGSVFRTNTLRQILRENREGWGLAQSTNYEEFLAYLLANNILQEHRLVFPKEQISFYARNDNFSVYEMVSCLGENGYISHFSAAFLHEIVEQVPKSIYVTLPHIRKRKQLVELSQEQITASFLRSSRLTQDIASWKGLRIIRVNGTDYNDLGITRLAIPNGKHIRISDVERTLIDLVIRPEYGGGVVQVQEAFFLAKEEVSTNRLISILRKMELAYPYHQAIGYYMQQADYPESSLHLVRRLGLHKDFYLLHAQSGEKYIPEWRLFVPEFL